MFDAQRLRAAHTCRLAPPCAQVVRRTETGHRAPTGLRHAGMSQFDAPRTLDAYRAETPPCVVGTRCAPHPDAPHGLVAVQCAGRTGPVSCGNATLRGCVNRLCVARRHTNLHRRAHRSAQASRSSMRHEHRLCAAQRDTTLRRSQRACVAPRRATLHCCADRLLFGWIGRSTVRPAQRSHSKSPPDAGVCVHSHAHRSAPRREVATFYAHTHVLWAAYAHKASGAPRRASLQCCADRSRTARVGRSTVMHTGRAPRGSAVRRRHVHRLCAPPR